jgi:hypothetical protein
MARIRLQISCQSRGQRKGLVSPTFAAANIQKPNPSAMAPTQNCERTHRASVRCAFLSLGEEHFRIGNKFIRKPSRVWITFSYEALSTFQPFIAFTVIAAALLDPLQATIAVIGLISLVLIETSVHPGLAWRLARIFG